MDIKKKKKEVELLKVTAAKADMELRICERQADIERIEADIVIQDKRIAELKKELEG